MSFLISALLLFWLSNPGDGQIDIERGAGAAPPIDYITPEQADRKTA